jgi:hypothetical protein
VRYYWLRVILGRQIIARALAGWCRVFYRYQKINLENFENTVQDPPVLSNPHNVAMVKKRVAALDKVDADLFVSRTPVQA